MLKQADKVGDIRKLGGDVIPAPTPRNPYHSLVNRVAPEQTSKALEVEKIER